MPREGSGRDYEISEVAQNLRGKMEKLILLLKSFKNILNN